MTLDISRLLSGWKFEPNRMQARLIPGEDGREKLQIRLYLGLFQMELDGRPDGLHPEGAESLLEHLEARNSSAEGTGKLTPDQLSELMREGVQYYNRYMALFALGEYDRVARDTARNLRLFRFIASHVESNRDRWVFEQYTPFVTMMHGRALGEKALKEGRPRSALRAIDEAIESILGFFREQENEEEMAECGELSFLRSWRREIEDVPASNAADRLEEQLKLAVAREDYEDAAQLRDQLRRLQIHPETETSDVQPATESPDHADQLDQPGSGS